MNLFFRKILCDFFILNTCSVTSHADNQALYLIKQFRAKNKKAKVVLTGCFAQTAKGLDKIDADIILGNDEKLEIAKYLKSFSENEDGNCCADTQKNIYVQDIFSVEKFPWQEFKKLKRSTRPSIKIQEGCSNRCSYCIIPYARGNSRSDTIGNIISEINFLADKGYKEVVLVGIHIGEWGREFNKTLLDLLKEIEKTRISRYRLGSLYVTELDDNMIEFLKDSKKFCPHFHLSLQSGSSTVLKRMNRHYSPQEYLNSLSILRKYFDNPAITTDIIVGFPQETEEEFEETMEFAHKARFAKIHVFKYSRRYGTIADQMHGQIQETVKSDRSSRLSALEKELGEIYQQQVTGKYERVLFEEITEIDNKKYITGYNERYIRIAVPSYSGEDLKICNTIQEVCISGRIPGGILFGYIGQ